MASGNSGATPFIRWARRLLVVAVVILALPYLVTLLYLAVDPVSMPMMWRWMTGARVERSWVNLTEMAPALPLAVIVAEDRQF